MTQVQFENQLRELNGQKAQVINMYALMQNEVKEEIAEKLLYMALKHQDREFWWAGGMHRGGLCACYDDKWGLSLNYIAVANKVRISKDKEL